MCQYVPLCTHVSNINGYEQNQEHRNGERSVGNTVNRENIYSGECRRTFWGMSSKIPGMSPNTECLKMEAKIVNAINLIRLKNKKRVMSQRIFSFINKGVLQ